MRVSKLTQTPTTAGRQRCCIGARERERASDRRQRGDLISLPYSLARSWDSAHEMYVRVKKKNGRRQAPRNSEPPCQRSGVINKIARVCTGALLLTC